MNKQTNKPQERWKSAGDKLHADAEGDHVLVSRDGYEQQPHWPEKELSTWSFWERGDGVKGLFAMSELLWIVGETHGYPLKHSVERDCENDEKASKSCLGAGEDSKQSFWPQILSRLSQLEVVHENGRDQIPAWCFPQRHLFQAFRVWRRRCNVSSECVSPGLGLLWTGHQGFWIYFALFFPPLPQSRPWKSHREPRFQRVANPGIPFWGFSKMIVSWLSLCLWADPVEYCTAGRDWLREACESRRWSRWPLLRSRKGRRQRSLPWNHRTSPPAKVNRE